MKLREIFAWALALTAAGCGGGPMVGADAGRGADADGATEDRPDAERSADADGATDGPPDADATPADDAAADVATDGAAPDVAADAGVPDAADGGGGARAWIRAHFAGAPTRTGTFTARTTVETPALVHDAMACCAKYAFDVRETTAPDDRRVGFVDVTIRDLRSTDAFGAGIQTASASGVTLFLAGVTVDPGWPTWVGYATTNYDGLVLDRAAAIYAEDLTVRNWNADAAIDNKAPVSQFVRLTLAGRGHRGIRYWGAGPHYLVASELRNEGGLGEGSLLWFRDCATVQVRVYRSTFNGSPTVPPRLVVCDQGSNPEIVYLTTDPRTTGEMHEMFAP